MNTHCIRVVELNKNRYIKFWKLKKNILKNNNQSYIAEKLIQIPTLVVFTKLKISRGDGDKRTSLVRFSTTVVVSLWCFLVLYCWRVETEYYVFLTAGRRLAWRQQYDFIWKHLKSSCLHFARSLHRVHVTPWSRTADLLWHRRFCFCLIACFSIFRKHTRKLRLKSILKKPSPPPVAEKTALKR